MPKGPWNRKTFLLACLRVHGIVKPGLGGGEVGDDGWWREKMQQGRKISRMRMEPAATAKSSQGCKYCWSLYSSSFFLILKMKQSMQILLEKVTVLDYLQAHLEKKTDPGGRPPAVERFPSLMCLLVGGSHVRSGRGARGRGGGRGRRRATRACRRAPPPRAGRSLSLPQLPTTAPSLPSLPLSCHDPAVGSAATAALERAVGSHALLEAASRGKTRPRARRRRRRRRSSYAARRSSPPLWWRGSAMSAFPLFSLHLDTLSPDLELERRRRRRRSCGGAASSPGGASGPGRVVEMTGGGTAREGRGGGDKGEERVCEAAEGGWFAVVPRLHDGEGLLHFAVGAAAASSCWTLYTSSSFCKMGMQHPLHKLYSLRPEI
jgi:hypothetical protein